MSVEKCMTVSQFWHITCCSSLTKVKENLQCWNEPGMSLTAAVRSDIRDWEEFISDCYSQGDDGPGRSRRRRLQDRREDRGRRRGRGGRAGGSVPCTGGAEQGSQVALQGHHQEGLLGHVTCRSSWTIFNCLRDGTYYRLS
jgi:hypothetical protein